MSVAVIVLTALTGLFILYLWSCNVKTPAPLPPGPKGIPILGNIFDLPLQERWFAVTRLAKEFGDLCYLSVLGQHVVFLNTSEASVDLLERQGSIYSDRLQYVMAGDLCGFKDVIVCVGFGEQFKRQRKLIDRALGSSSVRTFYEPMIEVETKIFLQHLMEDGAADYRTLVRRYAGSLTLSIVYGHQVHSDEDKFLSLAETGLDILSNHVFAGSGIWPVDIFPFLKHIPSWFPGAGFKRHAILWKEQLDRLINEPYLSVKEKMHEGSALPSFCATLLGEDESVNEQKEHDIKYTANAMFSGSTETTIGFVGHLILALTLYPEVLAKAQKEIDAIVNNDRWPTLSDRPHLPYTTAVLSECLRWSVPAPLNFPHRLQKDNVYRNMYIPEGTLVIANIWSMCRNELLYPNPDVFNPERFMEEVSEQTAHQRDPRNFVFGFGRRRCPGVHLIESSLWSLTACMLATFKFSKAIDDKGNVIEPDIEYPISFFRILKPFKCDIKPRPECLKLFEANSVA